MFVSFSYRINQSKKQYYNAYKLAEGNAKISGVIDVTPFLVYFAENLYNKVEAESPQKTDLIAVFNEALKDSKSQRRKKILAMQLTQRSVDLC